MPLLVHIVLSFTPSYPGHASLHCCLPYPFTQVSHSKDDHLPYSSELKQLHSAHTTLFSSNIWQLKVLFASSVVSSPIFISISMNTPSSKVLHVLLRVSLYVVLNSTL